MKIPFSYERSSFAPLLFISLLGHVVCLGSAGLLPAFPQFSVRQAPSSVEVVLIKEEPEKPELKQPTVFTAPDALHATEKVVQKEKPRERKIARSEVSPLQKGALQDWNPNELKNPAPVYPRLAREAGWQGVVVLKVLVDRSGRAAQVEVEKSSGYSVLDQSALKTVRQWRFRPTRFGRLSFSSSIQIPVRFVLVDEV